MELYSILLAAFLIGYAVNHFVGDATLASAVAIVGGIAGVILLVGAV